jgi:hypothetical protein
MHAVNRFPFIILTIASLLFYGFASAQIKKVKKTARAGSTAAAGMYSAQVWFSGNGLQHVKSFTCFGPDVHLLMKSIDSASNGAVVLFDYLKFTDSKGVTKEIKEIPYRFNTFNDTVKLISQAVLEVNKLKAYDFISGTVYFSGFGYRNVEPVKANDKVTLHRHYERCGPGTIITLDNCVYKNANGSLGGPLSKSVKLE